MKFTMRLTLLCLTASTVGAAYAGFFGKPTSQLEDNEKTRRIQQQLRKNLGENNFSNKKTSPSSAGPRGAKSEEENERALKYYSYDYYYEPEPYYHKEPEYYYHEEPYYEHYNKKSKYPYYSYPKYYKSMKSKKGKKSMKWGGKMGSGKMGKWNKWQHKWKKPGK